MSAPVKSRDEIEDLKRQWRRDPCWDIEDTAGFEAHREELLAYSQEQKAKRAALKAAFRRRLPQLYRGEWFDDPDEIAEWCNVQAAEGYRVVSITPYDHPPIEGVSLPGVYVLMERAAVAREAAGVAG